MTTIHLAGSCGVECELQYERWEEWARQFKLGLPALIKVTTDEEYLKSIGTKSRNMISKAKRRGYTFGYFDYNNYLRDIYAINVSMPERGGKPMTASYSEMPDPISTRGAECIRHSNVYVGARRNGQLWAYCQLAICGELAIINRILGHKDALTDGVMNGLIAQLVVTAREHQCDWINYLTISSASAGLARFKESVGFKTTEVVIAR